jgi:hypothetical protein
MKAQIFSITLALLVLGGLSSLAAAAPVEKTDGFVCPVFNSNSAAGMKNPNAVQIGGGDYTVIGPDVSVPLTATNADGAGTPPGPHSVPGDSDYTAIWAG